MRGLPPGGVLDPVEHLPDPLLDCDLEYPNSGLLLNGQKGINVAQEPLAARFSVRICLVDISDRSSDIVVGRPTLDHHSKLIQGSCPARADLAAIL